MQRIVQAEKIFTGTDWLYNHEIAIEDDIIQSIEPSRKGFIREDADSFVAPAFIDFQVYGAAGRLLAVYPTADTLQTMQEVFSKEGTCLFQPTLATNTIDVFKKGIDAVRDYWSRGGKGVYGLHLEGPWINPVKRGAHIESLIHSPTIGEVKELLAYGKGVIKTITLAPEVCNNEIIKLILADDVIISAGHSNATYQEGMQSFDAGVRAVTHLFNAMSPLHHREPGLAGAALQHPEVAVSIIPDGHHVDFTMIALAKRLMGDRLFAITDAVTETTDGPYQHHLSGDKYECNGTLSGSAISMHEAFYRLVTKVGIEIEEALRMCSLYPARVMKMEHLYGKIAPGFAAQFVVLNKQLGLVKIIA
ncbi:MAG: N-acetylglucosamine-6-phosphate deacetylase [Chitinophagaceae bacterium]|nr:MAG: N-acetylglucosamine-6-phosphate deacetylase [Chitinophagaceae bacterium]